MNFLQLCADRYSVRSFAPGPIPDEILDQILEAGRLAPTAMNLQPQRIYVLRSEDALCRLRAVKKCYGADTVLLICGGGTTVAARIIYTVVALAGVWCISLLFRSREYDALHE